MMIVKMDEMMRRRGIKTQGELAKLAKLSQNTISSIKGGSGRIENIGKLCDALDCQPGDLLEYVPDPKKGAKKK